MVTVVWSGSLDLQPPPGPQFLSPLGSYCVVAQWSRCGARERARVCSIPWFLPQCPQLPWGLARPRLEVSPGCSLDHGSKGASHTQGACLIQQQPGRLATCPRPCKPTPPGRLPRPPPRAEPCPGFLVNSTLCSPFLDAGTELKGLSGTPAKGLMGNWVYPGPCSHLPVSLTVRWGETVAATS